MGDNTLAYIILTVSAGFIAYMIYKHCTIDCTAKPATTDKYEHTSLSSMNLMKRTPVTYSLRGGLHDNPHYKADPQDRLVPAVEGGVNPYKRHVNAPVDQFLRNDKDKVLALTNDAKTRRDLVASGEMTWFRTLNNIPSSAHGLYETDRPYEHELESVEKNHGLYDPSYHQTPRMGL